MSDEFNTGMTGVDTGASGSASDSSSSQMDSFFGNAQYADYSNGTPTPIDMSIGDGDTQPTPNGQTPANSNSQPAQSGVNPQQNPSTPAAPATPKGVDALFYKDGAFNVGSAAEIAKKAASFKFIPTAPPAPQASQNAGIQPVQGQVPPQIPQNVPGNTPPPGAPSWKDQIVQERTRLTGTFLKPLEDAFDIARQYNDVAKMNEIRTKYQHEEQNIENHLFNRQQEFVQKDVENRLNPRLQEFERKETFSKFQSVKNAVAADFGGEDAFLSLMVGTQTPEGTYTPAPAEDLINMLGEISGSDNMQDWFVKFGGNESNLRTIAKYSMAMHYMQNFDSIVDAAVNARMAQAATRGNGGMRGARTNAPSGGAAVVPDTLGGFLSN